MHRFPATIIDFQSGCTEVVTGIVRRIGNRKRRNNGAGSQGRHSSSEIQICYIILLILGLIRNTRKAEYQKSRLWQRRRWRWWSVPRFIQSGNFRTAIASDWFYQYWMMRTMKENREKSFSQRKIHFFVTVEPNVVPNIRPRVRQVKSVLQHLTDIASFNWYRCSLSFSVRRNPCLHSLESSKNCRNGMTSFSTLRHNNTMSRRKWSHPCSADRFSPTDLTL